jgi:hypothetical protein
MVTPKNSRETENARKPSIFKIPFDWGFLGSSEISKSGLKLMNIRMLMSTGTARKESDFIHSSDETSERLGLQLTHSLSKPLLGPRLGCCNAGCR